MKVTKYFIFFDCCEVEMSTEIEISKSEYEKQLKFLNNKIDETKDWECPMEVISDTYDNERTKIEYFRFDVATGSVYLKKITCKEGFYFKTKKELK